MGDILVWFIIILLAYFGPPLLVYALAQFVTWGAYWNPGEWAQDTRAGVAIFWAGYALFATLFLLDLT